MSIALFLLSTSLLSCSSSHNRWELEKIRASTPCITYAKASLSTCKPFDGLEAVFFFYGGTIRLYLNALTLQFPIPCNPDSFIEVNLIIAGEKYAIQARRLEGGQRLLLPDDAAQLIINSLLNNNPVEVSVYRYQTLLITDNFSKIFQQITQIP